MDVTPTEFLKKAINTAEHFGFKSLDTYRKHSLCKNCSTNLAQSSSSADRKLDSMQGLLTGGISHFVDTKLHALEEPSFFYTIEQIPRSGEAALTLQIFGVSKSIGEAILIQTARSVAIDLGFTNQTVRINSLGDTDSTTRYTRELTNYLKKRLDLMPPTARDLMKEHVFSALMHLIEKEHELAYKSPNPLEYLSDTSRKHFREIVEYLDMSETPYEIDPKLIGSHLCYSDALFSIDILDSNLERLKQVPLVIKGGRYNNFVYRHTKQDISAVGAVIILREKKAPARNPRSTRAVDPSVYVVQLGFGPKIKSLLLVDELRRAGIPVHQNLASDSLSTQLRDAENRKVKYTIIIGQKEYVDGTVILRDMEARSQEHVPITTLTSRLRRSPVLSS